MYDILSAVDVVVRRLRGSSPLFVLTSISSISALALPRPRPHHASCHDHPPWRLYSSASPPIFQEERGSQYVIDQPGKRPKTSSRTRQVRIPIAAAAHSVVLVVVLSPQSPSPVTAAQQSELEERNALCACARSEWSVHAPRAAPVDIVVLESEVERWEWMWGLAHSDWSRGGVLGEKQVCDKARSDLSPPAPGPDDDDELTSTESVDLSAPSTSQRLDCDLTLAPRRHHAPLPFAASATTSDKAKAKPPPDVIDPNKALFAAGGSTSDKERDEERELAVDLVPVRASASAVSLEVDDANKALFAASGRPFLGHHQRRRGLHARDPIDELALDAMPMRVSAFSLSSITASQALFVAGGSSVRGPSPPSPRTLAVAVAVAAIARARMRTAGGGTTEKGNLWVRASGTAGGEGTEKAKGKPMSTSHPCRTSAPPLTSPCNATDEARDNGSTSVQVLRKRTKTCSGALSIFSAAAVKDIKNTDDGGRGRKRKAKGAKEDEGLAAVPSVVLYCGLYRTDWIASILVPAALTPPSVFHSISLLVHPEYGLGLDLSHPDHVLILPAQRPYLETTLLAGLDEEHLCVLPAADNRFPAYPAQMTIPRHRDTVARLLLIEYGIPWLPSTSLCFRRRFSSRAADVFASLDMKVLLAPPPPSVGLLPAADVFTWMGIFFRPPSTTLPVFSPAADVSTCFSFDLRSDLPLPCAAALLPAAKDCAGVHRRDERATTPQSLLPDATSYLPTLPPSPSLLGPPSLILFFLWCAPAFCRPVDSVHRGLTDDAP
ncbi:hypothetical protein K438DRAFT_1991701 [Mycena galopus ATCC 62051]|nr:hypothetical protein K438DRAFT_1991701 [Mycena galopus ATCC 62051]